MNYWPLLGVAVVVIGFVLRMNPLLVVVGAGLVSGLAAQIALPELLTLFGKSFVANRGLLLIALTLPVIGVLERAGLKEHAHAWIAGFRGLSLSRFLIAYLAVRQIFSMFGLTQIAGHAQTVRPLVAPMAQAAAERSAGELSDDERQQICALAAATDNIGLFFGEDVFIALGAVLLIQGFFATNQIVLEPLDIAIWAAPTALAAFVLQALRLQFYERGLCRRHQASGVISATQNAAVKHDAAH